MVISSKVVAISASRLYCRRIPALCIRRQLYVLFLGRCELLAVTFEYGGNSPQEDVAVQPQAPFLDVLPVEGHFKFERRIEAGSDLPSASDTGDHVETAHVLGTVMLNFFAVRWPWSNHAHVAHQHTPELR